MVGLYAQDAEKAGVIYRFYEPLWKVLAYQCNTFILRESATQNDVPRNASIVN